MLEPPPKMLPPEFVLLEHRHFCYNRSLFLLPPMTFFATCMHCGVGRRRRCIFLLQPKCYHRFLFLLEPTPTFATISFWFCAQKHIVCCKSISWSLLPSVVVVAKKLAGRSFLSCRVQQMRRTPASPQKTLQPMHQNYMLVPAFYLPVVAKQETGVAIGSDDRR